MKSHAFVSGAAGFVGQAITKELLNRGYVVTTLDLPGNPVYEDFTAQMKSAYGTSFTVTHGDITQLDQIQQAIPPSALVFHTAALLNSIASERQFEQVNVLGTQNMCTAAVNAKATRFVLISTSDVFGIPNKGEIIAEHTPYRPWGEPYADSKIKACNIVKRFQQNGSLATTIIYPGWVYGPGDRQFFPAIIEMVKDKHAFIWHKHTPYRVDLIYITDLVNAIMTAATSNIAIGEDYLILDNNTDVTPEVFFRFIASRLNSRIKVHKIPYLLMYLIAKTSQFLTQKGVTKEHLLSTTDVKAFGNDFTFTNAKATDQLQWRTKVTPDIGLETALEWQLQRSE